MSDQPTATPTPGVAPTPEVAATAPAAATPASAKPASAKPASAAPAPAPPAPAPPAAGLAGERKKTSVWSNLNLNGPVPARVRPSIGEWGPTGLPSTKQKKRGRWLAPVFFTLALAVVVLVGWYFWLQFR